MISSVASSWELVSSSLAKDILGGSILPRPEDQNRNISHEQERDKEQGEGAWVFPSAAARTGSEFSSIYPNFLTFGLISVWRSICQTH